MGKSDWRTCVWKRDGAWLGKGKVKNDENRDMIRDVISSTSPKT